MIPDHYATLGVAPSSSDAVIRAAYLELMRRYHPDKNPSAAAAARVTAITVAYSVLGVQERRAHYDGQRARHLAMRTSVIPVDRREPRLGPWLAAAFGVVAIAVALPFLIPPPLAPPERPNRVADARQARATPVQAKVSSAPAGPAVADSNARVSEQLPLDRAGTELPPVRNAAVAPSDRPTSSAEKRADERAAIAQPLASTAPRLPAPAARVEPQRAASPTRVEPQRAAAVQDPSFSCELAKNRAQLSVCNSASLAALDRQTASIFGRSLGGADASTRALLLQSDGRFLARRDGCSSESCVHGAYVDRIREIREITAGRQPSR